MALALQTFSTVRDANAALKAPGTRYLGGGTLVVRAANEGDISVSDLVRSTDPTLSGITVAGGNVRIGASVTMAAIARHPELAALSKAARAVGGPAIRNMATVGGNLFAPAPYGDFAVALLALDATVSTDDGELPIEDFLAKRDGSRAIVTSVSLRAAEGRKFPLPESVAGQAEGRLGAQHRRRARTGRRRHCLLGADRARLHGRPADARPRCGKGADRQQARPGRHRSGAGCSR